jgi:hypothetical protein
VLPGLYRFLGATTEESPQMLRMFRVLCMLWMLDSFFSIKQLNVH